MSFPLSLTESLLWDSIRRPFLTADGNVNPAMTAAFAKSAIEHPPKIDFSSDYTSQLPLLLVFLKSYPEHLDEVLPVLYKVGNKQQAVRDVLDDVHANAPDVMTKMLPELFKTEKSLALQIPLLMDMGRYLEKDVFESLDFKLLLKATPERLLKAFTPSPATWDAFMDVAAGLVKNDSTKQLAHMIACSVGLQVATAKPKSEKNHGITQYDWVDVAALWKKHDWSWTIDGTIKTVQLRAKGECLIADMLYSASQIEESHPGKSQEAVNWLNTQPIEALPLHQNDLDQAVRYVYTNATASDVKIMCLTWFNTRAEKCSILRDSWRFMPHEDLVAATTNLVDHVLIPMGETKASVLSYTQQDRPWPEMLRNCSTRLYTVLNHSNLPLGNMDAAMNKILHAWCAYTQEHNSSAGSYYDNRHPAVDTMLDTIAHDLQEPARQALQGSNAFKQLLLYSAYLKEINPEWSKYTFQFMPDLTAKPLSMMSVIYPEHQDTWAMLQAKVLDGSFKHTDTIQLVAKVLFNQNLTLADILNTCSALDCKPEVFFCSLQSPSADVFIPESFDFSEVIPL